jgi:hypothetical protein
MLLPYTLALLQVPSAWTAWTVAGRGRLTARARLRDRERGRVYRLALHHFDVVGAVASWHDHRYACAVHVFCDVDAPRERVLYRMPFRVRDHDGVVVEEGVVDVGDGTAWAIHAPTAVLHEVHSQARHCSVLLSDVTDGPARPDRLRSARLGAVGAWRLRRRLRRALAQHLSGD